MLKKAVGEWVYACILFSLRPGNGAMTEKHLEIIILFSLHGFRFRDS
jgi:hypothetical protein